MSSATAYTTPTAPQVAPALTLVPALTPHLASTPDDAFASSALVPGAEKYALDSDEDVMYAWAGTHWQAVPDLVGERQAAVWLRNNYTDKATAAGARAAWSFSKLLAASSPEAPSAKPDKGVIIPTRNAYLRIQPDGRISAEPHERGAGMRYLVDAAAQGVKIGRDYIPKPVPADSLFGKFLAHAQKDADVLDFIQEQAALTLMPGQPQIAAWWYGAKGSGKSTLAAIVKRFHYRAVALDLKNLDGFRLEKIVGASLVVCTEVDRGKWAEGIFKQLTGGDEVQIDRKGRPVISYTSDAKWIICSNPMPWITDPTGAVHRRIAPVCWARTVDGENRNPHLVDDIMRDEAHIVLDWLLLGVQRIVRDHGGRFRPESKWPSAVRRWARDIRGSSNVVANWIDSERIGMSAGQLHSRREIFQAFQSWATEHGEHEEISEPVFWRALWSAGECAPAKEPECNKSGVTANGKRTMMPMHRIALPGDVREGDGPVLEPVITQTDPFAIGLMEDILVPTEDIHSVPTCTPMPMKKEDDVFMLGLVENAPEPITAS
jgi:P4 family phage/plasmid primase-like protien